MSDCLVQVYCEDGEEYGLYRYDVEKVGQGYVYSVIPALFALHGDSEDFDEALRNRGIERVYIDQEVELETSGKCEPVLMSCWIRFKDDAEKACRVFAIGSFDESVDDDVFFWVDGFDALEALMSESNDEDFVIESLAELEGWLAELED